MLWDCIKTFPGNCLSCYQCDSNEDADCTEYFDHEHYTDLTVRSTECTVDAAKYCIKTTGVWGGKISCLSVHHMSGLRVIESCHKIFPRWCLVCNTNGKYYC